MNTNNNAIEFQICKNVLVRNNEIHNTGMRAGMGLSSNDQYIGLYIYGNNNYCESNLIDSVGYNGLRFEGDSITIKNNYINHFCMTKDDGGGLYTWGPEKTVNINRRLENNIILNGIGAGEGTNNPGYIAAEGIYMDDRTTNVEIINNTVANNSRGIFIHNANNISIIGNTLYNNNTQILFVHDRIAPTYPITDCNVKGNIFFSKLKSQVLADYRTIDNDIPNFGLFDYNYYCRPVDDNLTFYIKYVGPSGPVLKNVSLETWQTTSKGDLHSKKSPVSLSITKNIDDYLKFIYNPTSSVIKYDLGGNFMDVKGNKFTSYILQPFTSAILVKDPDPSVPPVNQTPLIIISNPSKGNKYEQLASIVIEAVASDPDGTISKVEFYSGITKLVDLTSPPYSYIWKDVEAGSYSITAIATDNLNATTTSSPVEFKVEAKSNYDTNPEILNLYPNPNRGHFSIEFINALL